MTENGQLNTTAVDDLLSAIKNKDGKELMKMYFEQIKKGLAEYEVDDSCRGGQIFQAASYVMKNKMKQIQAQ